MRKNRAAWMAAACLLIGLLACNLPSLQLGDSTLPTPRPTVIVITAEGPYLTDFNRVDDWLIGEGTYSSGQIVDGEYVLAVRPPQYLAWTNQQRAFGDGIYEVDARLISGPEASGFGLLLLGTSDLSSFFYVMITGDGRYDIGYCQEACEVQESLVGGYRLASAILVGNQVNHLRVELFDGQMTLLVNGAPVSQVKNLSYGEGLLGLIGESAQYGGFQAGFDNLRVVEENFLEQTP